MDDKTNTLQREMTGVGRASLVSETACNRSIMVFVVVLDRSVSRQQIVQRLNAKLLSFDRFRSKVDAACNYFQLIPEFDCIECVEEHTISASSLKAYVSLKEFIEQTMSSFSNRPFLRAHSLPMWRLHMFQCPSVHQTILLFRCHHCICDGITFGAIWQRLVDDTVGDDDDDDDDTNGSTTSIASAISAQSSLWMESAEKCNQFWCRLWVALLWILAMLYVLLKLCVFLIRTEPITVFKPTKMCEQKYVSYVSQGISVAHINKARKSLHLESKSRHAKVTFNDYMLSVIAESMMLYLTCKQQSIPNCLRVAIPANIRDKNTSSQIEHVLGNKIGSYVIDLPIAKHLSFLQKLKRIKQSLDLSKRTPEAKMSHWSMVALSCLPQYMADVIGPRTTRGLSLVVSNVRGASTPQFICSAKVTDAIGIVPPPMGVALGYAILTFQGKVIVTVNVDKNCYDENTANELIQCLQTVLKQQGI